MFESLDIYTDILLLDDTLKELKQENPKELPNELGVFSGEL